MALDVFKKRKSSLPLFYIVKWLWSFVTISPVRLMQLINLITPSVYVWAALPNVLITADKTHHNEMNTRRLFLWKCGMWMSHIYTRMCKRQNVLVCVCVSAPASLGGNICCRVSEATCPSPSCSRRLTSLQNWSTVCTSQSCSRKIRMWRNSCLIRPFHGPPSETARIRPDCSNQSLKCWIWKRQEIFSARWK